MAAEVDDRAVRLALEVAAAKRDVGHATQALHDIRGLLGFDNDGDTTPNAQIAGARSVRVYAQMVIADVRNYIEDEDERAREDDAALRGLRGENDRLQVEKHDLVEQLMRRGSDPT